MSTMSEVTRGLDSFFNELDSQSLTMQGALEKNLNGMKYFESQMSMMWASVSDRAGQAFADMVMAGELSFSGLVDMVARTMIQITAQMALINPLMNLVFGLALPTFFGGAAAGAAPAGGMFADGGRPPLGKVSVVGEEGPELFVPDTAGTIVYHIDARGATTDAIAELKRMMAQINASVEPRAIAAMGNWASRGKGF
jgi:hypothetical protein